MLEYSNTLAMVSRTDISNFLFIERRGHTLHIANRADGINDFSKEIVLEAKCWRFVVGHAVTMAMIDECFVDFNQMQD
jgi:hypothetical protein